MGKVVPGVGQTPQPPRTAPPGQQPGQKAGQQAKPKQLTKTKYIAENSPSEGLKVLIQHGQSLPKK